jgi:hypothetical protein
MESVLKREPEIRHEQVEGERPDRVNRAFEAVSPYRLEAVGGEPTRKHFAFDGVRSGDDDTRPSSHWRGDGGAGAVPDEIARKLDWHVAERWPKLKGESPETLLSDA